MKKIFILACALSLTVGPASAHVDCTGDGNRMGSIQTNIIFCVDNALPGADLMIRGRYDARYTPLVKQGYEICQRGRPGMDHARICDEATFWAAAQTAIQGWGRATGPAGKPISVNAGIPSWQGPLYLFPGPNLISVDGTWKSDKRAPAHGPSGMGALASNGLPQGALLWSFSNGPAQPSTTYPQVVSGPGTLYFRMNDDEFGDNFGYLTVKATPQ